MGRPHEEVRSKPPRDRHRDRSRERRRSVERSHDTRHRSPPLRHRSRSPHNRHDKHRQPNRPDHGRIRDRSRDRNGERRDKSRNRSRDRSKERGRDRSKERSRDKSNKNHDKAGHSNSPKEELSEEQEMLKLMGFAGFDSTKGKHVPGNDVSAVHLIQKRKYRQYMNRKGGFNRPLDFVA